MKITRGGMSNGLNREFAENISKHKGIVIDPEGDFTNLKDVLSVTPSEPIVVSEVSGEEAAKIIEAMTDGQNRTYVVSHTGKELL